MKFPIRLIASVVALALCSPVPAQEPTIDVQRFEIEGDNPLGAERTAAILSAHVGPARTLNQLEDAALALEKALQDEGQPFHRVLIPAQKPAQGAVVLQIVHFTLSEVEIEGNEHFSNENIRRSLPALVEGRAPDLRAIGRDLTAANSHPSKNVQLTFREGRAPDTLAAGLKVRDVDPIAIFSSLNFHRRIEDHDNRDSTYRFALGIQHSNLFDRDHVATLSYTTDLRPGRVSETTLLGAFYQMPLLGSGRSVSAYYTYSDVSSGRVQQGGSSVDVAGSGEFWGLRVTQALPRIDVLQQSLSAAIDFKHFDNKTTLSNLGVVQPLGSDTGSRPLSLRYVLRADIEPMSIGGSIEYAWNTGGGIGNDRAAYLRDGNDFHWDAWRATLDFSRLVANWTVMARARGQWSGDPLISGEQFGLGGTGSVRGFRDREVSGERGYQVTLEAIGPGISQYALQPVLFMDFGSIYLRPRNNDPAQVSAREGMLSAGVGLRWNWQRKLDLSLDLAHVFDGRRDVPNQITASTQSGDNRLHLGLFYRF
ncbi:ShlB/FhaC/HecB family hemolysin secretion/activation protein [Methyloversatilis sp.]|uniref:ShlB/FhaC/HecB family hemolysin secretion/activation protein n=1 Tax=Methyloversatilis sp. TaxID=2569862 RepID=UPI0035B3A5E3